MHLKCTVVLCITLKNLYMQVYNHERVVKNYSIIIIIAGRKKIDWCVVYIWLYMKPHCLKSKIIVIVYTLVWNILLFQIVFGDRPVSVTCPKGHTVTTNVSYKNGRRTFLIAVLLCVFLGPCCALIPFCVNSMKDVEHTCPLCGTVVGAYIRAF